MDCSRLFDGASNPLNKGLSNVFESFFPFDGNRNNPTEVARYLGKGYIGLKDALFDSIKPEQTGLSGSSFGVMLGKNGTSEDAVRYALNQLGSDFQKEYAEGGTFSRRFNQNFIGAAAGTYIDLTGYAQYATVKMYQKLEPSKIQKVLDIAKYILTPSAIVTEKILEPFKQDLMVSSSNGPRWLKNASTERVVTAIAVNVALELLPGGLLVQGAKWSRRGVEGLAGILRNRLTQGTTGTSQYRVVAQVPNMMERLTIMRRAADAVMMNKLASKIFSIEINGVVAQRILIGNPNKIAIIGRPMGGSLKVGGGGELSTGVLDYQKLIKEKYQIDVATYNGGTVRANAEFELLARGFPNRIISDDVVVTTRSFKQNVEWAAKLRKEGYTVIDLGANGLPTSPFYSAEIDNIFGKLNPNAKILNR